MEEKNKYLVSEIERLTILLEKNNVEVAEWRMKYVEYSNMAAKIQEHLVIFCVLFAEIESLRYRVLEKEREIDEVRKSSLALYKR